MKIAIVGVTGLVGETMLKVLDKSKLPVDELLPVASERSLGKKVKFRQNEYSVISVENAISQSPEFAIFSAGKEPSLKYAPLFAQAGTRVIDNSSAWRMHPDYKLIVPEINGNSLTEKDFIIANPNCSTIQMLMVLAPLHNHFKINRVVVSTYQSVSGTGRKAITQMENERKGIVGPKVYPYSIDKNCLPHIDVFEENGYTKEEMKMVNESRKILNDQNLKITATAVRVPVVGGHSESVNVSFEKNITMDEVYKILRHTPGVVVYDNLKKLEYPMPILTEGKNEVFVGRIRRDESFPNCINLWIVADNLRKGAATNAIQIAELIYFDILK